MTQRALDYLCQSAGRGGSFSSHYVRGPANTAKPQPFLTVSAVLAKGIVNMTIKGFPVGQEMEVSYPPFKVYLRIQSATELTFAIREGRFARTETVEIQVAPIGDSLFAVSWKESNGATVVNVQDYDRAVFQSFVTLTSGEFWRMTGSMVVTRSANKVSNDRKRSMNDTLPSRG